jgi:HSP20 family protein
MIAAWIHEEFSMPVETASEPPFKNVARQMNKFLDQLQKGYSNFCPSETWTPTVNLYENDTAYLVCVDLAGVDKDKIDVLVEEQQLVLRGTRAVPTPEESGNPELHNRRVRVHVMEIDHGSFSRHVELPEDVVKESIAASYRNGMLWIELPKKT